MKKDVLALILVYSAIASAISEDSKDYRFSREGGSKFNGALYEGKSLRFVSYYFSSDHKTSYQTVTDSQRTCGPYERNFETSNSKSHYSVHVLPLNADKVLVYQANVTRRIYTSYVDDIEIVDLSSCKASRVIVSSKPKQALLGKIEAIRANSFDIVFVDPALCENSFCRQTYDLEGKNISAVITTYGPFKNMPQVTPIESPLYSKGEIAIGKIRKKATAFLVKDGFKMLQQFKIMDFPVFKTNNNAITFAEQLNPKTLNITQFDLEGKLKFNTVLNYKFKIKTTLLFNAPHSTVYAVGVQCYFLDCDKRKKNHYTVKKVDASGKEVGSLIITFPPADAVTAIGTYQTEESYCISRLQEHFDSQSKSFYNVEIVTKCFSDADFK